MSKSKVYHSGNFQPLVRSATTDISLVDRDANTSQTGQVDLVPASQHSPLDSAVLRSFDGQAATPRGSSPSLHRKSWRIDQSAHPTLP
ncbi:hypothetical protein RRG08_022668 [Elysia crispata]|uniref:Uncharacterized protein n=1 Tax=Elysia crispata TaxID=231223 RepID=A0AAE0Z1M0_9GAST|nr:hypothetical protein RRG08_022668 [Elysia crispata]